MEQILPKNIWIYIFSYLPIENLSNISQTCKLFNKIIKSEIFLEKYAPLIQAKDLNKASFNLVKKFIILKDKMPFMTWKKVPIQIKIDVFSKMKAEQINSLMEDVFQMKYPALKLFFWNHKNYFPETLEINIWKKWNVQECGLLLKNLLGKKMKEVWEKKISYNVKMNIFKNSNVEQVSSFFKILISTTPTPFLENTHKVIDKLDRESNTLSMESYFDDCEKKGPAGLFHRGLTKQKETVNEIIFVKYKPQKNVEKINIEINKVDIVNSALKALSLIFQKGYEDCRLASESRDNVNIRGMIVNRMKILKEAEKFLEFCVNKLDHKILASKKSILRGLSNDKTLLLNSYLNSNDGQLISKIHQKLIKEIEEVVKEQAKDYNSSFCHLIRHIENTRRKSIIDRESIIDIVAEGIAYLFFAKKPNEAFEMDVLGVWDEKFFFK